MIKVIMSATKEEQGGKLCEWSVDPVYLESARNVDLGIQGWHFFRLVNLTRQSTDRHAYLDPKHLSTWRPGAAHFLSRRPTGLAL
jgi:hypothetical protein